MTCVLRQCGLCPVGFSWYACNVVWWVVSFAIWFVSCATCNVVVVLVQCWVRLHNNVHILESFESIGPSHNYEG
jgi:hypothetical protein